MEKSTNTPERHGKKWESNEENFVLRRVKQGATPQVIATELKRTVGGIISHLRQMACIMINSGKTLEEASLLTGLPELDIEDAMKRRDAAKQYKESRTKNETSVRPAPLVTKESYSRDYLKTLSVYNRGYQIEDQVVKLVLREASSGHTQFIVNGSYFYEHHKKEQITDWLVSRLKERFPGVSVEYREATDLRGNVERGIIIDWS